MGSSLLLWLVLLAPPATQAAAPAAQSSKEKPAEKPVVGPAQPRELLPEYVIGPGYGMKPGAAMRLAWEDGALLGTLPSGAQVQIFLASPTEEAVRTVGAGSLRCTLDADGIPVGASLIRAGVEQWRATRRAP